MTTAASTEMDALKTRLKTTWEARDFAEKLVRDHQARRGAELMRLVQAGTATPEELAEYQALHAQQALAEEVRTVCDIHRPVLLIDDPAFLRDLMVAIESSREYLFSRRIGHQITGKLPRDKILVRQVFVEGMDNPVSPWPLAAITVVLETM